MHPTYQLIVDWWREYGGLKEVIASKWSRMAFVFTVLMTPLWLSPGWWDMAIGILPSMLGFSLAAYTMLLAFSDERFQELMATAGPGKKPPYIGVSSAFVAFIVFQLVALLLAILAKAWYLPVPDFAKARVPGELLAGLRVLFWGVGFHFFMYSLFCGLAATFRIFRLIRMYVAMKGLEAENKRTP